MSEWTPFKKLLNVRAVIYGSYLDGSLAVWAFDPIPSSLWGNQNPSLWLTYSVPPSLPLFITHVSNRRMKCLNQQWRTYFQLCKWFQSQILNGWKSIYFCFVLCAAFHLLIPQYVGKLSHYYSFLNVHKPSLLQNLVALFWACRSHSNEAAELNTLMRTGKVTVKSCILG